MAADLSGQALPAALAEVLRQMRAKQNRSSEPLAEDFEELPSRKEYPDYYRHVKAPIALQQVEQKLGAGKYTSIALFAADLDLLFSNAISYNAPGSDIYEHACTLRKFSSGLIKDLKTGRAQSGAVR